MTRSKVQGPSFEATPQPSTEQGFMLLGLIVAVALILIALSVAASKEAFTLRREREVESVRRANQYVRAIQLYYKKFGRYPGTIEQLEGTNGIRYLRQRYVDPLTGKADYRLIGVGQNQTTVKGFFGEPLAGIASTGLGTAAGMASTGTGGTTGSSSSFGSSSAFGSTGIQSQSATGFSGASGPFMGVGSNATGNSIIAPNEQTTYQTWEFLYDPRIEKLKLAAALNGGGPDSLGGGTLGQSPSSLNQSPSTPNGTNQSTFP
jgi:type II secretory pathway pseudopilin PulG